MTHFWEPLSDDAGAELFGTLWPADANTFRLQAFIARANELAIGRSTRRLRIDLRRGDGTASLHTARTRGKWYTVQVSGNPTIVVGDRGRVVLPAGVRERNGLDVGTPLTVIETPNGIALLTRAQLRDRVRNELSGLDLVGELILERRQAAEGEGIA